MSPFQAGWALGCNDARNALTAKGSGTGLAPGPVWQRSSHANIPAEPDGRRRFLAGYAGGITHILNGLQPAGAPTTPASSTPGPGTLP
jgi:hypothetical protein